VTIDEERVYSDEEFSLILRKATELASRAESTGVSDSGLTLAEMKAAAAQVGFDPDLIERAARLVATSAPASAFERLIGGPLRHHHTIRFPVMLSETRAAELFSVVRITASLAGSQDTGHFGSMGMTWHDGGDTEALSVTARPTDERTAVSVVLDRRVTLGLVVVSAGVAMFLAVLFAGSALYPESAELGAAGAVAGIGGPLAIARSYWAASTRRVRERLSVVIDAIGQTLSKPDDKPDAMPDAVQGDSPKSRALLKNRRDTAPAMAEMVHARD
jgi:hypothetical protein